MQKPLCYATLGDLDGGAGRAIIGEALADVDDRGGDEQPRKVQIVLTLKQMENGQVATHLEAAPVLPKRRTAPHIGKIARDSKNQTRLMFQDMDTEDPDQRTIDEAMRHHPDVE